MQIDELKQKLELLETQKRLSVEICNRANAEFQLMQYQIQRIDAEIKEVRMELDKIQKEQEGKNDGKR